MAKKFYRRIAATGGNIRIRGGHVIPKWLATHRCACAECLGEVGPYNNGIRCLAEPERHQGLILKSEAAAEAQRREQALQAVEAGYTVRNGRIEAIDDPVSNLETNRTGATSPGLVGPLRGTPMQNQFNRKQERPNAN